MRFRQVVVQKRGLGEFVLTAILVLFMSLPATSYAGDIEVLISGERLKQDLDVANKSIRPLGQLKKAGFTIQNVSKNLYHLEYQAVWFDEYTQTVSTSIWQRFTLPPNMGKGIVSLGKTPDSKKVVFQVRLPDDEVIKGKYFKQGQLGSGADKVREPNN